MNQEIYVKEKPTRFEQISQIEDGNCETLITLEYNDSNKVELKSLYDHDKELVTKVLEKVKKVAFSSKVMCDKDGSPFYGEKNHTIYGIYDYELNQLQKEIEK